MLRFISEIVQAFQSQVECLFFRDVFSLGEQSYCIVEICKVRVLHRDFISRFEIHQFGVIDLGQDVALVETTVFNKSVQFIN